MSCSTAPYRPIVFIDEAIPGYDYVWLKFRLQYASSGTITIFVNDVEVLKTDNLEATVTGLNPGSTYKIYGKLAGDSIGIVKNVTLKTAFRYATTNFDECGSNIKSCKRESIR